MLTIGALFAGYGGLELGVQAALDQPAQVIWYAEYHPHPAAVMAHHHPDAVNLGDVRHIDFTAVPRVDILTGGTPCQDLSHAGKRGGMNSGTRSNLWVSMREAVAELHPTVVVWENVRGALSAGAESEMEPCPGCLGNPEDSPLRAFGRVLGDLAGLGYRCGWVGLPASAEGAPHGRYRIFLLAQRAVPDPT